MIQMLLFSQFLANLRTTEELMEDSDSSFVILIILLVLMERLVTNGSRPLTLPLTRPSPDLRP